MDGETIYLDGEAERERLFAKQAKLGNAASLHELAADYEFYTPGITDCLCPIPEHPHVSLQRRVPDFQPRAWQFDKPVFKGFRNQYDHVLYLIEKPLWPILAEQLKAVTLMDREKRLLMKPRLRELTVADPLELQRRGLSTGLSVKVQAVCLETNQGCYYIDDTAGLQTPPVFRYTPDTFPDFVQYAERMLGPVT